jgi:hypothetical protein
MKIKIKNSFVTEANSNRIKGYLLSKAMRKEDVTDAEIKKIYKMSDADFDAAVDVLVKDGIAEKT